MTRRCQESWGHITPSRDQTHMKCWGCGAKVKIEEYEHPRYGISYMLTEHEKGAADVSGERPTG